MHLIAFTEGIFFTIKIFSVEKDAAFEATHDLYNGGKSLYYAGVATQIYWLYVILRDIAITLRCFLCESDHPDPRYSLVETLKLRYYFASVDKCLLTGIVIWGTTAIASYADRYRDAPPETGQATFAYLTTFNVIMGFLYSCAHFYSFPFFVAFSI